jgi:transposase
MQRGRTGQAERVPHRPGRKLRAGEDAQQQVRAWFRSQPDLTLAEVQARLLGEAGVRLSIPQVWYLLRRLGLRLKKSRSTPPSATAKPTSGGAKSISPGSPRSRRRG